MRWLCLAMCLAMCLAAAHAHVPTFDNDLMEADVTDKSWGVYLDMKAGDSFTVYLSVKQGENISFSVNLAGSQADNSVGNYTNTTLWGHYANLTQCDKSFTGWGEERSELSRRLGGDHTGDHTHPPGQHADYTLQTRPKTLLRTLRCRILQNAIRVPSTGTLL